MLTKIVHEKGKIQPFVQREEKSKSSIAAQHQTLLQESNSKLLKEIMEKVEKLDIKIENIRVVKASNGLNKNRKRKLMAQKAQKKFFLVL